MQEAFSSYQNQISFIDIIPKRSARSCFILLAHKRKKKENFKTRIKCRLIKVVKKNHRHTIKKYLNLYEVFSKTNNKKSLPIYLKKRYLIKSTITNIVMCNQRRIFVFLLKNYSVDDFIFSLHLSTPLSVGGECLDNLRRAGMRKWKNKVLMDALKEN